MACLVNHNKEFIAMGDVLSLHTVVKSNDDQVDGRPSKKCKELKVLDPKAGQNLCEYGLA